MSGEEVRSASGEMTGSPSITVPWRQGLLSTKHYTRMFMASRRCLHSLPRCPVPNTAKHPGSPCSKGLKGRGVALVVMKLYSGGKHCPVG